MIIESLINFNLKNLFERSYKLNYYINSSFIDSRYTNSEELSIIGNKVDLFPQYKFKNWINFWI